MATSYTTLPQGTYHVRVSYDGYGLERTGFTTFFVDNELPNLDEADLLYYYDSGGTRLPCPNNTVITSYTYTDGAGVFQIDLGAVVRDRPTTGIITTVQWQCFVNGHPISEVTSAYGPADWGAVPPSNVVTLAFINSTPDMRVETDIRGGMDGQHTLNIIARDAAGLSAYTQRTYWVNVEGPLIYDFVVNNEVNGITPISGTVAPTKVSLIQDQYMDVGFKVRDERNLARVVYRCYPRDGYAGGDTDVGNPPFVPNSSMNFNLPSLVLDRDSFGSAFSSIPQSYTLDVWSVNVDGLMGPIFKTHFEFQYLVDLAIVVPDFKDDADNCWIKTREQQGIANHLWETIQNVATKRIYCVDSSDATDRFSQARCWPDTEGHKTLPEWMSANTSDNTTDVLIIVDAISRSLYNNQNDGSDVEKFLDSDADNDDAADTEDGDVVIYIGSKPFKMYVNSSGGHGEHDGSDEENLCQILDTVDDKTGGSPLRVYPDNTAGQEKYFDDAEKDLYMKHRNWRSAAFFPSLVEYKIRTGPHPNQPDLERWQCGPYGEAIGATLDNHPSFGDSYWKLAEYWNHLNGDTAEPGTAYMLQNVDSNGRFVQFMSFGDSDNWGTRRKVVEQLPYLIEEFLKNYVVSRRDPSKTAKRVVFRAAQSGTKDTGICIDGNAHDDWDLLRYPTSDDVKPFQCESPEDRSDCRPWAISASGEKLLFSSQQHSGGFPLTAQESLYILNNGAPSMLLACDASTNGIVHAAIADDGVGAVCSTDRTAVASDDAYSGSVVYHFDLSTGLPAQITTGEPAPYSEAVECDLSGDGRWAAIVSKRYYGKGDVRWGSCYPPFGSGQNTLATSGSDEIFRWSLTDYKVVGGSGGFTNAWVSEPDGTVYWPWENVENRNVRISRDGKTVAWLTKSPVTDNKWELCLAREFGGSWFKARLTTDTDIQQMDMSSV